MRSSFFMMIFSLWAMIFNAWSLFRFFESISTHLSIHFFRNMQSHNFLKLGNQLLGFLFVGFPLNFNSAELSQQYRPFIFDF